MVLGVAWNLGKSKKKRPSKQFWPFCQAFFPWQTNGSPGVAFLLNSIFDKFPIVPMERVRKTQLSISGKESGLLGCELLTVDGVGQNLKLLCIVQDLNPLSVWVITNWEGPWDCSSKVPETKSTELSKGHNSGENNSKKDFSVEFHFNLTRPRVLETRLKREMEF